jgi:hypothetical protein
MYQPIQLKTKLPSLGNSLGRSLVAIITLLLAATASVQSAAVSESSAAAKRTDAQKLGGHRIFGETAKCRRPRNSWIQCVPGADGAGGNLTPAAGEQ